MRTDEPPVHRLIDYRPPDYLIDEVVLNVELHPRATRVTSKLAIRRNGEHQRPLRLDGVRLKPISATLDGHALVPSETIFDESSLTIAKPPAAFMLQTVVEIDPEANRALEGLYMSGGRFCTQCEAEGFRKITWFLDRPDVLARFTVRIEAPKSCQRLLSNGNLVEAGELPGGLHYALWRDPFPKPCYLFALVGGELDVLEDAFTTRSGREVTLRIFVDPGMAPRAAHAMDSLKRAMKWDEDTFGREYDLDLFMIVAVRDFNFGAMENKGLNIFNSSLLLADSATATDVDFEHIEAVIAHEYFHNWTGNRVTCRDWFQLCLKEGLTVFRDQSFSADMRSEAVQRIEQVRTLRARQFSEDAGPLAHPVRPTSYQKIDNFYTATVYEKGAEVIRMLKTLIGPDAFRAGMDLYFERWDGKATTIEAFLDCFAETSGRDLSRFRVWYDQAGTPRLELSARYDEAAGALELHLKQEVPPTPGQPEKQPAVVPLRLGLLDEDGRPLGEDRLIVLEEAEQTVRIEGVPRRPVISALRGFSAPVTLKTDAPVRDAYVLLASDPDLFNRWEAGQNLARDLILARAAGRPDDVGEQRYAEALERGLRDQSADPAFKALLLSPPGVNELTVLSAPADPGAIHAAREALCERMATHLGPHLVELYARMQDLSEFAPTAAQAGRRALRNAALALMARDPTRVNVERARAHFSGALNMTDAVGGMSALLRIGGALLEAALEAFYARWQDDPLVVDKWFALQAQDPSEHALERVRRLVEHPAYDARTPNRVRAVAGAFANGNPARFHDPSGEGYRFLADQVLEVDRINPTVAARLCEPLGQWARYTPELARLMRRELERIRAAPGLSANTAEQVEKALA